VLLTLSPLFWAGNWIIGRGLHADIPPMAMTFFRWLFAIVILAPFAWRHVKRDWPILRTHWKFLVVLGRDRRRHAQQPGVPRAQLHDGDQRCDPQFVHSRDDRDDVVAVPAREAAADAARRRWRFRWWAC
jgi:hypothetical protein